MPEYAENQPLYPPTFDEWFHARVKTEDIESFAYPPNHRDRYKQSGLDKMIAAGLVIFVSSNESE